MILTTFDWVTIGAYFAVVFAIGFYFARRERTSKDYFLAGRNVFWFAIGTSIFASNIGSEHLIGLAGEGARNGLAVGAYEWAAIFCIMMLAWVFLPYYLRSNVFTMPEFLERRFNPGCRWTLTSISLAAYVFTKISVALFAGAILLQEVIGWPLYVSAVVLVVATGIYTIAGGLSAVIYTELIQTFILIGGSLLLTLIGLDKVGGFEGLRETLPAEHFQMAKSMDHPAYPWTGTIFGIFILGVWYWCSDQVIVQRALAAKNLSHSRGGAILTAWLKIIPVFIFVVPGLIACKLWPAEIAETPDRAYVLIVTRLLPAGAAGLMIAALLAALMSSLSAVFNSCSTLVTMDVYKKFKPHASEKQLVLVGRLVTAAVVVISLVWIPMIPFLSKTLYLYLQSIQAYIGAPIAAVFLLGVFWKRATGTAALITMIVGGVLGAIRFATDVLGKMGYNDFGPFNVLTGYAFLNYAVIMFLFCIVLMVVISLLTKKPEASQLKDLTFSKDTVSAGIDKTWVWVHAALSVLVVVVVINLWAYFA